MKIWKIPNSFESLGWWLRSSTNSNDELLRDTRKQTKDCRPAVHQFVPILQVYSRTLRWYCLASARSVVLKRLNIPASFDFDLRNVSASVSAPRTPVCRILSSSSECCLPKWNSHDKLKLRHIVSLFSLAMEIVSFMAAIASEKQPKSACRIARFKRAY